MNRGTRGVTLDYFRREVRRRVETGDAFTAYWHPMGIGFLRTAPILIPAETRYAVQFDGHSQGTYSDPGFAGRLARKLTRENPQKSPATVNCRKTKPRVKQISPATIKRFKTEVERLRKTRSDVHTADFDGQNLATTFDMEGY